MLPFGGHQDGVFLLGFLFNTESVLLALQDELVGLIGIEGGEDGEEVFPRTLSAFRILIRKVVGHVVELEALVVQISHRDLIVPRWVAMPGVLYLQQLLIATDDLLEPFRVEHIVWRYVVLTRSKSR